MTYKYFNTQRPIGSGTFPKQDGTETVTNFDEPTFCEEIGRKAWGYIEYNAPLTDEQISAYELTPAGMKKYWCVMTSIDDRGRIISNITNTVEAASKPENRSTSTSRKDIYSDWFDSYESAKAFVEESKKA